eukprot:359586-Chlamydomonas_euryale.AAC.10
MLAQRRRTRGECIGQQQQRGAYRESQRIADDEGRIRAVGGCPPARQQRGAQLDRELEQHQECECLLGHALVDELERVGALGAQHAEAVRQQERGQAPHRRQLDHAE